MNHPHIDPKRARPSSARLRKERARRFAEQARHEARTQKLRLLFHAAVISLGVWGIRHTDLSSNDPFESGTLVLLDILFCIYLLLMVFIESWNRTQ